MSDPWWRSAVVYQIYPRSFCDTTGNGIGDLEGIRRKLDHLVWLGVDALWLSPIFPSPMADHGYDVADYCDVEPLFGSLEDLDRLLDEAHARGLRLLLDWVPNHSSDRHPWFLESRASRDNPKRDWYVWVDGTPETPPTPWQAVFPAGPAWAWDERTRAWYLHRFTPEQPDLNWSNPDLRAAMLDTLRFWLDRGVDGFRMDVVHFIGIDPSRIAPGFDGPTDPARSHAHLREIRRVLDGYTGDRVGVGEVYILEPEELATYLGHDDELHLAFNFRPVWVPWDAKTYAREIDRAESAFAEPRWPTWVLSNHDRPRHRTRFGRDGAARAAAVWLLGVRGTPFLYAGEELGLQDAAVPPELVQDPMGSRDGCRAPLPWDATPGHGWASPEPWLPWPPEVDTRNVAALREDETSILHLYRRLLAARRASPALHAGRQRRLDGPDDVIVLERERDGDRRRVLVNFAPETRRCPADGDWIVEVASDGVGEGAAFDGRLAPDGAVVLRPER